MNSVNVSYDDVKIGVLFSGDFDIKTGNVYQGKKAYTFTNKVTGVSTDRWIPLERIGKDQKKDALVKARKKRLLENRARRAEENRARAKHLNKK